ncbi:MAG: hydroxysqualene dehydroxylase HpnE [Gammaproteobacteria bacterium]|nr:hydroxysqualene dehydroxylase HpnE [Gammaproteobacteria bacterium]
MKPSAIVVGGGWAGLSCAVELVDNGFQVTVLEASPELGGRARSVHFTDLRVDNGQHLLIGAYRKTLNILNKMGHKETDLFTRLPMQLLLKGADKAVRLKLPAYLPTPLNLAWALLTMQGFNGSERIKALGFSLRMRLRNFRLTEDQGLDRLLRAYGQTDDLITNLWEPLCLATLNTPIQEASAQLFLNVLRDTFGRRASDTDILLPHRDIGQLLPALANDWLQRHGGTVLLANRVTKLFYKDEKVTGLACGEQEYHADHIILASPFEESRRLLQEIPGLASLQASLQALHSYPITTIYLRYAQKPELTYPLHGLLGSHSQWIVDRAHCQQANLLAVVISGPGDHIAMDKVALAQLIIDEIRGVIPKLPPPLEHMVIKEKRATFRAVAGVNRYRPQNQTPLAGLWLAGDYTHGAYPATLEGAVQSGVQCARLIYEQSCTS